MASAAPQLPLLGGREALAGVQLLAGGVSLFDLLREANLVVLGEQRILPDVGEIEPNQVFLVALNSLLRHRSILRSDSRHQKFFGSTPRSPASSVPPPRALYDNHLVKRPNRGPRRGNRARSGRPRRRDRSADRMLRRPPGR